MATPCIVYQENGCHFVLFNLKFTSISLNCLKILKTSLILCFIWDLMLEWTVKVLMWSFMDLKSMCLQSRFCVYSARSFGLHYTEKWMSPLDSSWNSDSEKHKFFEVWSIISGDMTNWKWGYGHKNIWVQIHWFQ